MWTVFILYLLFSLFVIKCRVLKKVIKDFSSVHLFRFSFFSSYLHSECVFFSSVLIYFIKVGCLYLTALNAKIVTTIQSILLYRLINLSCLCFSFQPKSGNHKAIGTLKERMHNFSYTSLLSLK